MPGDNDEAFVGVCRQGVGKREADGSAAQKQHGRIGEEARALARRLAPTDYAARSAAMRNLYQALGCTLQRLQADSVVAALGV